MRRFWARTALGLLLAALACGTAAAQQHMKLLAPGTGWVLSGNKLYWTTDNGEQWTDITPPGVEPYWEERIASVYFRDTALGWVLLSNGKDSLEHRVELATTTDSGASWTVSPVDLPPLGRFLSELMAPGGEVFFLNRSQGWLAIGLETGMNPGMLVFATSDGGETWVKKSMAAGGALRFTSPEVGWIAGGRGPSVVSGFYMTWDGGADWKEITLDAPKSLGEHPEGAGGYGIPVFVDSEHGFETVSYFGGGGPEAQVLFSTSDGGRTWMPDKVLQGATDRYAGVDTVPFTVAGSVWLTVRPGEHALTLVAVPLSGTGAPTTITAALPPKWPMPFELSFVSPSNGWAWIAAFMDGGLRATTDGGATWKYIDPHHWPKMSPPVKATPSPAGSSERHRPDQ